MPATVEKPLVAVKPKGLVFFARRSGLRLVMKPEMRRRDAEGNVIETILGQHLAFVDGKLEVPLKGEMRGEHGEVLDVAEVRAFLLGDEEKGRLPHSHFGDRFDGFWLHEEPAPGVSKEEHDLVAELGMDLDRAGLERLIAEEEAGWARDALLSVARSQLERVELKAAERESELAQARAEGAEAAAPSAPEKGPKAGPASRES